MKNAVIRTTARMGALLAAGALAGCASGTGTKALSLEETVRISNLAQQDFDRIVGDELTDGVPGTNFEAIPTTGSARFTGPGVVSIFSREQSTTVTQTPTGSSTNTVTIDTSVVDMIGVSTIDYDFASNTFDGKIQKMSAATLAGDTSIVLGEVTFSNGSQSDPEDRPTALQADATGTVDAFGTAYTIDVDMTGLLRGTNPSSDIPVKSISLSGTEGTIEGSDLLVEIDAVGDKFSDEGAFNSR